MLSARIERFADRLERVWRFIGSSAVVAIMVIVAADVAMRYLLNAPFEWSFDLIYLYLMPAVFFFYLAPSFADGHHVRMTVVVRKLPVGVQQLLEASTAILTFAVFVVIAREGYAQTLTAFINREYLLDWPTWVYNAFVPLGSIALLLRLALHIDGRFVPPGEELEESPPE